MITGVFLLLRFRTFLFLEEKREQKDLFIRHKKGGNSAVGSENKALYCFISPMRSGGMG